MIYGGRLRLRAIEREDVKRYYQWVNDPEVTCGLSLYLPMSTIDEEKWFETQQERDPHERPLAIELQNGEGWKLIGNCGVFDIEWTNSCAELGIMIGDKSVWNQGFGSQVMTLLLRHCFETLNLNRAFLRVFGENARARRSYEKAGFVDEGCMRQAVFKNGKYDDVYIMSVLRSEWDARKVEG
jgi:RimJ/RimL family protein N-acetyltransferase